jgi:tetratricopeptide (TPR) repeat protein
VIDPAKHVFHQPETKGASCVDCHMPKRSYMGRDPRSDHRFPSPDPLLTKELGVPNACNDCHADKGLDWQIEWTHKWYGEDMNAVSRARTRAVDAAQHGKAGSLDLLVKVYEKEEIDAWKASLLRLMEPWAGDSRVMRFANTAAESGGPLSRSAAGILIARRGQTGPLLAKLLSDPLMSVRVETGWAAIDSLPADHPVLDELEAVAKHQADQPAGAMRMARLAMARGRMDEAEKWFKRTADWDRTSPVPRRDFAVFLSQSGRTAESVKWLEEAAELAPDQAEIAYLLALALAETGDSPGAEARFRDVVRIDPDFARAWYNLGLLYAGENHPDEAIAALQQAAAADPASPDAPYARATVHLQLGQMDEALEAVRETLRRDPDHPQANELIRRLGQ